MAAGSAPDLMAVDQSGCPSSSLSELSSQADANSPQGGPRIQ